MSMNGRSKILRKRLLRNKDIERLNKALFFEINEQDINLIVSHWNPLSQGINEDIYFQFLSEWGNA